MEFSGDERGGVGRVCGREYGWPGESAARRNGWRRRRGGLWLLGLLWTAGVCPRLPKLAEVSRSCGTGRRVKGRHSAGLGAPWPRLSPRKPLRRRYGNLRHCSARLLAGPHDQSRRARATYLVAEGFNTDILTIKRPVGSYRNPRHFNFSGLRLHPRTTWTDLIVTLDSAGPNLWRPSDRQSLPTIPRSCY